MSIEIKILGESDRILVESATDVFDHSVLPQPLDAFLQDPRHHLIGAIKDGRLAGFISAVSYVHPDKPSPEFWINEVDVASTHRGQGIGRALMKATLAHARNLGCSEAWVLTEPNNTAAKSLYAAAGGQAGDALLFSFALDGGGETD